MLWEKTLAIKKKRCFLTIDDARVWHCHAGTMATGMLSIALLLFAIISHVTLLSADEFNKIVKVKDSFITLDQDHLKTIIFC